jgi:hypothetical protein
VAGASLLGGMSSASAAKSQGAAVQIANNTQADIEQRNAQEMARLIRRAGRRQMGETRAGYAGAGVDVNASGSVQDVATEQTNAIEHDAFQAILEGDRRALSLRLDGKLGRLRGEADASAAQMQGVNSALAAGYQGYSNWKTGQKYAVDWGNENRPNRAGA